MAKTGFNYDNVPELIEWLGNINLGDYRGKIGEEELLHDFKKKFPEIPATKIKAKGLIIKARRLQGTLFPPKKKGVGRKKYTPEMDKEIVKINPSLYSTPRSRKIFLNRFNKKFGTAVPNFKALLTRKGKILRKAEQGLKAQGVSTPRPVRRMIAEISTTNRNVTEAIMGSDFSKKPLGDSALEQLAKIASKLNPSVGKKIINDLQGKGNGQELADFLFYLGEFAFKEV